LLIETTDRERTLAKKTVIPGEELDGGYVLTSDFFALYEPQFYDWWTQPKLSGQKVDPTCSVTTMLSLR
jgi:hypothetical protein